ncbi:11306_t:CDS:1 [Gigaspora margarita]|uniref:11306_t:CDS:1 n=1 Tax=Gigaspora margarita TaxID=4874 RepID=A0ABN7UTZ5_GIGMA|nr:11306_t:CDS:1 [Gigaspora margarita]
MVIIKLLGSEFEVPEPEKLLFNNDDGTNKPLNEFIILRNLVNLFLRQKNKHPGDIEEVSKIASREWSEKTSDLDDFLKSYTTKVKSHRQKNLRPTFRNYVYKPRPPKQKVKDAASLKRKTKAAVLSNIKTNICNLGHNLENSVNMIFNGIPPTPVVINQDNQDFNWTEGNNNVVSGNSIDSYEALFEKYIDCDWTEGNDNAVGDNIPDLL